jgi:hypothetical protein
MRLLHPRAADVGRGRSGRDRCRFDVVVCRVRVLPGSRRRFDIADGRVRLYPASVRSPSEGSKAREKFRGWVVNPHPRNCRQLAKRSAVSSALNAGSTFPATPSALVSHRRQVRRVLAHCVRPSGDHLHLRRERGFRRPGRAKAARSARPARTSSVASPERPSRGGPIAFPFAAPFDRRHRPPGQRQADAEPAPPSQRR